MSNGGLGVYDLHDYFGAKVFLALLQVKVM